MIKPLAVRPAAGQVLQVAKAPHAVESKVAHDDQENQNPNKLVKVFEQHQQRVCSKYNTFVLKLMKFRKKRLKAGKTVSNENRIDIVDHVMRWVLNERIQMLAQNSVRLDKGQPSYNKCAENDMEILIAFADYIFGLEREALIQELCLCLHIQIKAHNFTQLACKLWKQELLSLDMASKVAVVLERSYIYKKL